MGKKAKKSGKKKGGKKKKTSEPQMTWKEALLAYQINIKERQLEDVRYDLRALEEKNERHLERNERLKQEQFFYMKHLLKQAKEFDKQLAEEDVVEKEQVLKVMMDKWSDEREEEKGVAELKELIAKKEAEIEQEQKQVQYWIQYQERGQHSHSTQIKLLQDELVDMQKSFDEMAAHLERTLDAAKIDIGKHTEDTLDKQKYLATEKAMAKLDKNSRQEVLDNDWLKREVEMHKRESDELMALVEEIEQENLAVMGELFECTVDDLKISRNFFLTQFKDDENLEDGGILEMDLARISLDAKEKDMAEREAADSSVVRPKSALQLYIEEKVNSVPVSGGRYGGDESEEDSEVDESDYDGDNHGDDSEEEDPFNNYLNFEDEAFDDYLQLGPLELKLLSIRGTALPIHKPVTPTAEEDDARQYKPYDWPLTTPMINKVVAK